jgi:TM2 domain-containing membrane protein YozV
MTNYNKTSTKSKGVALLLCLFLWFLGAHEFYLGQVVPGILYLVGFLILCVFLGWLLIPIFIYLIIWGLIATIEFFVLLFMSSENFDRKYNGL